MSAATKHDCDPCPGFAIFSTGIRPNGTEGHAFQRCDECKRYETDAEAVLAIVDVLTSTLAIYCEDLDGTLCAIENGLAMLRKKTADPYAPEALSRVRALQAAIRKAAEQ